MLKRPDEDFIKLKQALTELGQHHVVRYLEPSATDSTDQAEEPSSENATRTDFSQDFVPGWKTLIVNNRTKLVENLTVNDELITELIKFGVINVTFSEILKVMNTISHKYNTISAVGRTVRNVCGHKVLKIWIFISSWKIFCVVISKYWLCELTVELQLYVFNVDRNRKGIQPVKNPLPKGPLGDLWGISGK